MASNSDVSHEIAYLRQSWELIWQGIGADSDSFDACEQLLSRYSKSDRQYHTLQHLYECLTWFEAISNLAEYPAEVGIALWFHDAIYEVKRHDNEECSAAWAKKVLLAAGVAIASVVRVESLILATKHDRLPKSFDEQLLTDIDLSILGASEARFAEYERQIRAEYSFIPDTIFQEKRREILTSFLNRQRIYHTDYFYSRLEERARTNLVGAIAP